MTELELALIGAAADGKTSTLLETERKRFLTPFLRQGCVGVFYAPLSGPSDYYINNLSSLSIDYSINYQRYLWPRKRPAAAVVLGPAPGAR
jgi:hypothetical protein